LFKQQASGLSYVKLSYIDRENYSATVMDSLSCFNLLLPSGWVG